MTFEVIVFAGLIPDEVFLRRNTCGAGVITLWPGYDFPTGR